MIRGLLGKKVGMTQIFDAEGNITPVSVVEVGPCTILGLKEKPVKVVLGYAPAKENRLKKPEAGFFKKLGVSPLKHVKEFASSDNSNFLHIVHTTIIFSINSSLRPSCFAFIILAMFLTSISLRNI